MITGCQVYRSEMILVPTSFQALPGYEKDSLQEAWPVIKKTCNQLLKSDSTKPMISKPDGQGIIKDWHPFCHCVKNLEQQTDKKIRQLLETYLKPYEVYSLSYESQGLFTGYYEPLLKGSKIKTSIYRYPLYKLPSSSINKYLTRQQIVQGALAKKGLELVWVTNPIDSFFLEIQGSGRIQLENGQIMLVGFAGQNGHLYFPIGKVLLDRGEISRENLSLQTIKKWLKENPKEAQNIMNLNSSYVFFKEVKEGPKGSFGVSLTAGRSLAIDPRFISLGIPLWLDVDHPDTKKERLQRLVLAQDTGGAIKGTIRGDVFWGFGHQAEAYAGQMKSQGRYFILLPREAV